MQFPTSGLDTISVSKHQIEDQDEICGPRTAPSAAPDTRKGEKPRRPLQFAAVSLLMLAAASPAFGGSCESAKLTVRDTLGLSDFVTWSPESCMMNLQIYFNGALGGEVGREAGVVSGSTRVRELAQTVGVAELKIWVPGATVPSDEGVFVNVVEKRETFPEAIFTIYVDGDGNKSRIILFNDSLSSDTGRIRFLGPDGELAPVQIGESMGELAYELAPKGVLDRETDGTGALKSGAALVISDRGVESRLQGTLVYQIRDKSDRLVYVSAPAVAARKSYDIFVSFINGTPSPEENTGVASYNPDHEGSSRLALTLTDATGTVRASGEASLEPNRPSARFLNQDPFFPDFFDDLEGRFSGNLHLEVTEGPYVSLLGLVQTRSNALVAVGNQANPPLSTIRPRSFEGQNLSKWEVTLGDGNYGAPITSDDIETTHHEGLSELVANRHNRSDIQVHNITFFRVIDNRALNCYVHTASYEIRLPYDLGAGEERGTSVEGGLFIWGGQQDRLDYGLAFQWLVDPMNAEDFGALRTWNGESWVRIGQKTPDAQWHQVRFVFDHQGQATGLWLDGQPLPTQHSATDRPDFGPEVAARLQVETISAFPGEQGAGSVHRVQVRNWRWNWEPRADTCP